VIKRLIKIGDSLSQTMNVIFFDGHPNESLSGRAYRTGSKWEIVIDKILFFDPKHCKVAHENDIAYAKELLNTHINQAF